ncbi:hypothetical protein ACETRX_03755 [Labrys portucalensis]|uniref:Uncharacterized protein n=1 Tax=Labrys neptuniae TaxID=376174 RepID=A0ABV6Z978_9HYPH
MVGEDAPPLGAIFHAKVTGDGVKGAGECNSRIEAFMSLRAAADALRQVALSNNPSLIGRALGDFAKKVVDELDNLEGRINDLEKDLRDANIEIDRLKK